MSIWEAEYHYLFIDGGYLRRRYRENILAVFREEGQLDLEIVRRSLGAIKAFYYDGQDDLRKDNERDADFQARIGEQEEYFNSIRSLPGYHVRLGTLSGRPSKLRQKEVDVLLSVEMLTHAFYKNMRVATLIAGDLDFRPIVDALIRLGTYVRVRYVRGSAAEGLNQAADESSEILWSELHAWSKEAFRKSHPTPRSLQPAGPPSPELHHVVKQGHVDGVPVTLYRERGRQTFAVFTESF